MFHRDQEKKFSVEEQKPVLVNMSAEGEIQFIRHHIHDDEILKIYFSTRKYPIHANLLTMKLPWHEDGEEEYNFLGYAGWKGKKYFSDLVRLATKEAIDAALSEEALNKKSGTALHIILKFFENESDVIDLIQKASSDVISAILNRPCVKNGETSLSLALLSRSETVFCTLMQKANDEAIYHATQIKYGELNILEWVLCKRHCSPKMVDAICSRLNQNTIDTLGSPAFLYMTGFILTKNKVDIVKFKQLKFQQPDPDITAHSIPSFLAFIRYFSIDLLFKIMAISSGEEQIFFDKLSQLNAPLFNEFIRKILLGGYQIDLSTKAIYRLDASNLSQYLALFPEKSIAELKNERAYSILVNWRYKPGFDTQLKIGDTLFKNEMDFSFSIYQFLEELNFAQPLIWIILAYLEISQTIIDRVKYEIIKAEHPNAISELKEIYSQIKNYFPHNKELKFKCDESLTILSYVAPHPDMAWVAKEELKQSTSLSGRLSSLSKSIFPIFGQKKRIEHKLKIPGHQIELAQKSINDFLKENNRLIEAKLNGTPFAGTAPKTLPELKEFFQKNGNIKGLKKIEELERNLEEAYRLSIGSIKPMRGSFH